MPEDSQRQSKVLEGGSRVAEERLSVDEIEVRSKERKVKAGGGRVSGTLRCLPERLHGLGGKTRLS